MNDCLFCKIASKEIPSDWVWENEFVIAFLDINPKTDGHTLIIPKKHFSNALEMPEKELNELAKAVQFVGKKLVEALKADGLNVVQNIGSAAGQVVFHSHVHLIPRKLNDEAYPEYYSKGDKSKIKEVREQLKKEF